MTLEADRGAGLPTVCPFVAFVDERDLRAAEPDHRHRCYAEPHPAPRALAHQARFCLSPGFTSCPTFQDWATREAAHVAGGAEVTARSGREASGMFDENAALAAPSAPGLAPARSSAADQAGPRFTEPAVDDEAEPRDGDLADEEADERADEREEDRDNLGAAPGGVRDWDRPRPRRDYPRLDRSRRIPRVLVGLLILGIAALALFLLPSVITGIFGSHQAVASPTPARSAGSSPAGTTPTGPTAVPSATPLTYKVVTGDTLTKIAKKFNVTVAQILAANPTIKNADSILKDQVLVIPTAGPSVSPLSSP